MTDSLFKLDPLLPYWWLVIAVSFTIALLVWFEIKKANRFKTVRVVCVLLLVISLLGISLRPKVRTQRSDFTILLTENFDSKIVDSLERKYPGSKILSRESGQLNSYTHIPSANEIPTREVKLIVGNGLDVAERDIVEDRSFNFLPSPVPNGLISLRLPQASKVNSKSVISGTYNHDNSDSVKIVLEGPGGKDDSVLLSKKGWNNFTLSFTPRQSGNFIYSISVNEKKETVPIIAASEKQLKILFIQMFPTFETGYLKNFLAGDHKLVFRYQLSKNNFRYEYINHPAIRTDRLTNDILQSFDLVILDTDALKLLPPSEKKNLETSITAGLGALILFNENPKTDRTLQSILPITFKPISRDTAQFILTKKLNLPSWPVEAVSNGNIIPTLRNKDRILSGYVYKGFGKIGFQLLQETYKLTLEGDSLSYKHLWSSVLQKNARTHFENFQIRVENDFPLFANEPVTVQVIGSSFGAPILLHNGTEIAMAEDVVIDDLWKAKVWPDESGWHELQIKGDSTRHSYFVSEKGAWASLAAANSIRNTKAIASSKGIDSSTTWEYKPFAPWIFYLVFLVCAAVLWLVPKI